MTVLMREDLNDADLAWARADALSGRAMPPGQSACAPLPPDPSDRPGWLHEGRLLRPAPLRARSAP